MACDYLELVWRSSWSFLKALTPQFEGIVWPSWDDIAAISGQLEARILLYVWPFWGYLRPSLDQLGTMLGTYRARTTCPDVFACLCMLKLFSNASPDKCIIEAHMVISLHRHDPGRPLVRINSYIILFSRFARPPPSDWVQRLG
jgi:hypothetical protein